MRNTTNSPLEQILVLILTYSIKVVRYWILSEVGPNLTNIEEEYDFTFDFLRKILVNYERSIFFLIFNEKQCFQIFVFVIWSLFQWLKITTVALKTSDHYSTSKKINALT